jgi:hypothetical protein
LPDAEYLQTRSYSPRNLIEERPVPDSNAELPIGCLLLDSRQPCPAIDELKTVIEILLKLRNQPEQSDLNGHGT